MTNDTALVEALGTVGRAFFGSFQLLREVQRLAIPPIYSGENVLVTSATASGKTEAIMAPLVTRTKKRVPTGKHRVRLLLIAPTRALVNDLTARVEDPLARLGLTCGRQTGDHKDKHKQPFVLITTPESFDSMLVRDGRLNAGKMVDHLLAGVSAVFIDEAHLFDGTARGDQLCWLLGRLRRLRRLNVDHEANIPSKLQVCAGSATISNPKDLALRLLGPAAISVRVPGTREIEIFGASDDPVWLPIKPSMDVSTLRDRLELVPSTGFAEGAEQRLCQALSRDDNIIRKALVFVPSRQLCDILSAHLANTLPRRRELKILAHHGSLAQQRREDAERDFNSARDAVLVATTTLEVGIDIGDVDLVTLVGAPPSTRSLLQRIGRAGRRVGRTRVLALPRTKVEQAALASMLISARDGTLEPEGYARRWSVFVQQAASFVAQNKLRGRRRSDLLALAEDVWPEKATVTANEIVNGLLDAEYLVESQERLTLGEPWADPFDTGGMGMHANFDSSGTGMPVVDSSTGETIAHVAEPAVNKILALGGQRWYAQAIGDELVLKLQGTGPVQEGFQYTARSAPTGLEYAVHVRRGLGLEELDAPLFYLPGGMVWLHFGGSTYQALLCSLLPRLHPIGGLAGLAINGNPTGTVLAELAKQEGALRSAVEEHFAELEPALAPGPYQRNLPEQCRRKVVTELFDIPAFQRWLETRHVWQMKRNDSCWKHVRSTLLEGSSS